MDYTGIRIRVRDGEEFKELMFVPAVGEFPTNNIWERVTRKSERINLNMEGELLTLHHTFTPGGMPCL
jgi:hypothetical protein